MCELLGLCFNKKVNARISFGEFRLHSEDNWDKKRLGNPDGWGLAFYPDKSARIFKEPIPAVDSGLVDFIREYEQIQSKIFISHIRRASEGEITYCNTHPFLRELGGQDFVFAHNGTLDRYDEKEDGLDIGFGSYKPIGQTDSEWAFCWLMEQLALRFLIQLKRPLYENWTIKQLADELGIRPSEADNYNYPQLDIDEHGFVDKNDLDRNEELAIILKILIAKLSKTQVKDEKWKIDWNETDFEWLHYLLDKINEFGPFNCIFSDGERLFAYRDAGGYNSLMYLERKSPYEPIRLEDNDLEIDLKEVKEPDEQGVIIATKNLTVGEPWFEFERGQLLVVENGSIVFDSKENSY